MGPYIAEPDGSISFVGNNIFDPIANIEKTKPNVKEIESRVEDLNKNKMWFHISKINHQINKSVHLYFSKFGSIFILLPLTTRMISSPGVVYGKEAIDYTTDTSPIRLKWFELDREIFLSESSQIYLELSLVQKGIKSCYSVYNSFRKEKADYTHLSEFHHIEYEGKVNQRENEYIFLKLIKHILSDLFKNNYGDLVFFLDQNELNNLKKLAKRLPNITKITFAKALEILYEDTKNEKYKNFTMKNNFGPWEEIRLTNILDDMVLIREFPLLEVPFYHAQIKAKNPRVAENSDLIWPGFREILGSGQRVGTLKELKEKAKIFNLPEEDYAPYTQSRKLSDYEKTSGFGLGWERFLQGLLKMPHIWSVTHYPRIHKWIKL